MEALSVEPDARLINTALWLGLCSARLSLRKGAAGQASRACQHAAEHAPDDPEPAVLQVGVKLLRYLCLSEFGL